MRKIVLGTGMACVLVLTWVLSLFTQDAFTSTGPIVDLPDVQVEAQVQAESNQVSEASPSDETRQASRQPVPLTEQTRPLTQIIGRVLDAQGLPTPGCEVHLTGRLSSSDRAWELRKPHGTIEWTAIAPQNTGEDGRFELSFHPPAPYIFFMSIQHPSKGALKAPLGHLEAGITRDLGDILMPPVSPVRGRVIDARGRALPWLELDLYPSSLGLGRSHPLFSSSRPSICTKDDGSFEVWLARATYAIRVAERQVVSPVRIKVEGKPLRVEIILASPEDIDTISGRVIDDAGQAIANIRVGVRYGVNLERSPPTLQDGFFRLQRRLRRSKDAVILRANGPEHERWKSEKVVPWGTSGVVITMTRNPTLQLRVVDAVTRQPIEDYGLRHFRVKSPNKGSWAYVSGFAQVRNVGKHANGILRLNTLGEGIWHLIAEPLSKVWLRSSVAKVELRKRETSYVDIPVHRPAKRIIRLVREDQTPIAGSLIDLISWSIVPPVSSKQTAVLFGEGRQVVWKAIAMDRNRTNKAGEVELCFGARQEFALRALGPGHMARIVPGLRWVDDQPPFVLVVKAGATLEGRVGPPDLFARLDQSNLIRQNYEEGPVRERKLERSRPSLFLSRRNEMNGKTERFPPSIHAMHRLPDSGEFKLDGIPPGLWRVMIQDNKWISYTRTEPKRLYVGSVWLESGKTTVFNPQLEDTKLVRLQGSVSLNGISCANRFGKLLRWTNSPSLHVIERRGFKTNARGEFDLEVKPGSYSLLIDQSPEPRPYGEMLAASELVSLTAGQSRRTRFSVKTKNLFLEITYPDSTPATGIQLLLRKPDRGWSRLLRVTNEKGTTSAEEVPIGKIQVLRRKGPKSKSTMLTTIQADADSGPHRLQVPRDKD